ncbi:heavy-metal-associated domain-containing protein [Tepidibacter hydrothermalis]|uniref:Heavy-metal-associated domain-containing protein n=1 Tax=Tepidibacter hydrothermalis TaxID=3036126 RepID=A0ABY8E9Q8_9FIRM|nr:heavy-metal-associated domain-containing protein [Tepidibacter hydrothermalis]WFD09666.1 heavy-metal-associated domain-containing protein [Tepidibacter hydrothermalis]
MKKVINIEGMSCGHCAGRVKTELQSIDGVKGAEVSAEEKKAVVELTNEVDNETLKEAVIEAGYEVVSID